MRAAVARRYDLLASPMRQAVHCSRTRSSPLAGILIRTSEPWRRRIRISVGHLYDARSNRRRAATSYSDRAMGRQRFATHTSTTKSDAAGSLFTGKRALNQDGHLYGFRLVLTGSAYSLLAMRWTVPLPTPNFWQACERPAISMRLSLGNIESVRSCKDSSRSFRSRRCDRSLLSGM